MQLDKHINETYNQSHLIVTSGLSVTLFSELNISVSIIFQSVPELTGINKISRRSFDCATPSMVLPEDWRVGLSSPKPNPSITQLQHAVIHHSAGGNGNTNYVGLVRNYYVQHTQVNGWDDIGYNYLIAQNGTVFIGRDRQNLSVPYYNIQGAHFCAKNANTAGICMIGDFTNLIPTDTSLSSLTTLLAYMFYEEQIKATDSSRHPIPNGDLIKHIVGHREGCATVCPGDSIFIRLNVLRDQVEQKRQSCISWVHTERVSSYEPFYELKSRNLTNKSKQDLMLFSLSGKLLAKLKAEESFLVNDLNKGVYILISSGDALNIEKIFIGL